MSADACNTLFKVDKYARWFSYRTWGSVMPALSGSDEAAVDAHHHLWTMTAYSDISPYLEREYLADVNSVPAIKATVYLECQSSYDDSLPPHLRCVGETAFVERLAARSQASRADVKLCAAIIPFADLRLADAVDEVLQAHLAASPRTRGVRQCVNWDADPALRWKALDISRGMMNEPSFRRGFARLREYSLSFDAWLYHTQLGELLNLAHAFPDTPIVLDHLGGPIGIGAYAGSALDVYRDWKTSIDRLARCENVFIKLGGMNMTLAGIRWSKPRNSLTAEEICEKTRHYYLHAIDRFSPSRCMFESNFPVDKHTCTYSALWGAFDLLSRSFSRAERAAMFRGTASAFYRIDDVVSSIEVVT